MAPEKQSLVTGEMVGLFVIFGADLILLVVLLAAVGVIDALAAGFVTAAVLAGFGGWVGLRWRRLQTNTEERSTAADDPVETLKQRYAAGELSEEEFEQRLDTLLDSSRETAEIERSGRTAETERSR